MKAWKVGIICLAVGLLVGAVGSGIAVYTLTRPEADVVAHEPDAPVYFKPVEVVQSSGAGIITIEGAMIKGNIFAVVARNNLMSVTRKFDIIIPKQVVRHYGLSLGYGVMFDIETRQLRHNVDANYLYSFGRVFIGGGAAFQFDRDRLYQAGPRISAGFTF